MIYIYTKTICICHTKWFYKRPCCEDAFSTSFTLQDIKFYITKSPQCGVNGISGCVDKTLYVYGASTLLCRMETKAQLLFNNRKVGGQWLVEIGNQSFASITVFQVL